MLGSEKDNKYDDEERYTYDIEVVKEVKHSFKINKYNNHRRSDKINNIMGVIQRYEYDKEETIIYDK